MRRVLPALLPALLLAVLAPMIAVGCSRQPAHHVGEWIGESFIISGGDELHNATWHINEDGTLQVLSKPPDPPTVQKGRYKFDYSKKPIQLDINWNDNDTLRGIVQFGGASENWMHIVYYSSSSERPTNFEEKGSCWLPIKVKK